MADNDLSHAILLRLPPELLSLTISHLQTKDVKSLRMTCKQLGSHESVLGKLYRTICLSPLKKDLECCLSIASTSALAKHVRTLGWLVFDQHLDATLLPSRYRTDELPEVADSAKVAARLSFSRQC